MKVMVLGVGAVGSVSAMKLREKTVFEKIVLADRRRPRVEELTKRLKDPRISVAQVDASQVTGVTKILKGAGIELLINATLPEYNLPLMRACLEAGAHYIDLASTWAVNEKGRILKVLGQDQFAMHEDFARRNLIGITGMGIDPGVSNIFTAYAAKHLFDEIDGIFVRDGDSASVEEYDFAPTFSPWVSIAECISMPVVYENGEYRLVEPFSGAETFEFPEIGLLKCYLVEHEETVSLPKHIPCRRANFKYALGERFIEILRTLQGLGLTREGPIPVNGVKVSPRAVVCALLPDPAKLGGRIKGKTCVGSLIRGNKDGKARSLYLYNVLDHQEAYRESGMTATAEQAGIPPVIAAELIAQETITQTGVLVPEQLDPDPFMERLPEEGLPWGIREEDPSELSTIR